MYRGEWGVAANALSLAGRVELSQKLCGADDAQAPHVAIENQ